MKTLPLLSAGLLTATMTLVPLQTVEAKKNNSHHGHRHHYQRHHHYSPYYRHPRHSSGVILSFNFSPTPRYVAPVRSYSTYNRNVVADVQAALARRGYNVGYVDGVAGQRTRNALAQFQNDRGLRVTGGINEATLRALGL